MRGLGFGRSRSRSAEKSRSRSNLITCERGFIFDVKVKQEHHNAYITPQRANITILLDINF